MTKAAACQKNGRVALVYFASMMTAPNPPAPTRLLKAFLTIIAIWTVLCAIGAVGDHSDGLQRADYVRSYAQTFWLWWREHVLLMSMSVGCYAVFTACPALLGSMPRILAVYLLVAAVFAPLELLNGTMLTLYDKGKLSGVSAVVDAALARSGFAQFMALMWVSFTCVATIAACIWRESRLREQAWMRSQSDNLALRLELEQQRLLALRGQLEPHFLFNALNAISALVRSDDKRVALDGINHLSALLRYALEASAHDHVSVRDERQFLDDYLALQRLRYGARLNVHIDGDSESVLGADIPPLLLQPLIENALRHDLDCHDRASDIRVVFSADAQSLAIHVSNPASDARSANPGLGLGLRHVRERLQLAHGSSAALQTGLHDGRFVVDIHMPLHARDA
ncbi:sensor histidine kinase [Massilia sp. CCM 8734]|uniref:sensor histidine kinase n=1 Tax=Massilia sp. CCM 8734 TaxID=2609283 RepID=UPI00141F8932|nr:histidine kinase [Massilia sp. CCM 8734]NHZ96668.1 sensor histidine kinase [Massilia sp. CCM 8734]